MYQRYANSRLSHIILDQVDACYWKRMCAGRDGPQFSHLIFSNDLLLFPEVTIAKAYCIKHCLDQLCQSSGQMINVEKIQIYFSANIDSQLRQEIMQHTSFIEVHSLGKCLKANITHDRSYRNIFRHIIEQVQHQLSD